MTALHSLLDDWGLPQALIQLAFALAVFATVEYAAGDHMLPWGGGFVRSRARGRLLLRLAGAEGNARVKPNSDFSSVQSSRSSTAQGWSIGSKRAGVGPR